MEFRQIRAVSERGLRDGFTAGRHIKPLQLLAFPEGAVADGLQSLRQNHAGERGTAGKGSRTDPFHTVSEDYFFQGTAPAQQLVREIPQPGRKPD